jgi:acyl dehydratase
MSKLYFEDFKLDSVMTYGTYHVTAEEIRSFASEYDPQPMHLDDNAGRKSLLKGLSASGWQSCSIMMRIIVDGFLNQSASMGAGGVDDVRWFKPVYADDVLHVRHTITGMRASQTKPDRGFVNFHFQLINQNGDIVLEQRNGIMFERRAHAISPAKPAGDLA